MSIYSTRKHQVILLNHYNAIFFHKDMTSIQVLSDERRGSVAYMYYNSWFWSDCFLSIFFYIFIFKVRIFLATDHKTGDKRVMEQLNGSRPTNPHIPREFSSDSIDVFRINNLQKEHPPMFNTPSRTLMFTSDHLKYKNILENV
jgi:hypothetical protein